MSEDTSCVIKSTNTEIAQIKENLLNDTWETVPEVLVEERTVANEDASVDVDNVGNGYVELDEDKEQENVMAGVAPPEYQVNQDELLTMKTDILEGLSIVKQTEMIDREPLMKIRHSHKFKNIFALGNKALS